MGSNDISPDDSGNAGLAPPSGQDEASGSGRSPEQAIGDTPAPAVDQHPDAQGRITLLPAATARVSETQAALTAQISDTTKWLIAAMGAVAVIVLAGINLSTIASVHGDRFWTAIVAVAVSLVAVMVAIWRAALVLMPPSLTISVLCQSKSDKLKKILSGDPVLNGITFSQLPEERNKARAEVDKQEREYDEAYRKNSPRKVAVQDRLLRKRENAAAVERTIEVVETSARYYETRRRFSIALWALAIAAVVVFIAAPVFVVATGRAATTPSLTSCRYAAAESSVGQGKTDPPPCPVAGPLYIVLFTPAGRQAYEHDASALNEAICTVSKGENPLGVISGEQPVSVTLVEVNGKDEGPCITNQKFILAQNFGTIAEYQPTIPLVGRPLAPRFRPPSGCALRTVIIHQHTPRCRRRH